MVLGNNKLADYLHFIVTDFKKNGDTRKMIRRLKIKEMHLKRRGRFENG